MSREFGTYHDCGYFHTKLENAAMDAELGRWAQTKAMAPVLRALYEAAYACSSVEEHDWSSDKDSYARWEAAMLKAAGAIGEALGTPVRFDREP